MSWNYRIIKYEVTSYIFYRIAEVYYYNDWAKKQLSEVLDYLNTLENKEDYQNIWLWTPDKLTTADYETPADLLGSLELMSLAKNRPILEESILDKIAEIRRKHIKID